LEDVELSHKLTDARAGASRWASVAKKRDAILQQQLQEERNQPAAVLALFARHPAGDVQIPSHFLEDGNDYSDDDDYEPGDPYVAQHRGGDASPTSDTTQAPGSDAQVRRRNLADELEISDGSSILSPTSESASPLASPSGQAAGARLPGKQATASAAGPGHAGARSQSPSVGDSTSEDEDADTTRRNNATSKLATPGISPAVAPALSCPEAVTVPDTKRREESDGSAYDDDDFVEEEIDAASSHSSQSV